MDTHTSLDHWLYDTAGARALGGLARARVCAQLDGLRYGTLCTLENGVARTFGQPTSDPLAATVTILDARAWLALLLGGSIGAGESYMRGWWRADDLTALTRLLARNRDVLESLDGALARLGRPLLRLRHRGNRNTRRGARRNIERHYDLSNEFYARVLDPTMTYSCGIFEHEQSTLRDASLAKIDRLCRKLRLNSDDRLLEIGAGWGTLAIQAARTYGCRVTTTTISRAQYKWARSRIREEGLEDRVELLREDYRDLRGTYDKIISVEMIEAVGAEYLGEFFRVIQERLSPRGVAAIQAITGNDQRFARARRSVDFIQRYIFPGSSLPSVTAMCEAMTEHSDLTLTHLEDFTPHYARTLAAWRANTETHEQELRALGFDDRFLRMWGFYLAYCEGGFAERHIGLVQLIARRPASRHTWPQLISDVDVDVDPESARCERGLEIPRERESESARAAVDGTGHPPQRERPRDAVGARKAGQTGRARGQASRNRTGGWDG